MQLPCDLCMWGLIPMIKRELVLTLYKEHKLNKTSISKRLGITKGSVTQYIQGKRASNSNKLRKVSSIDKKISDFAKHLSQNNLTEKQIAKEFCNICKPAQKVLNVC